MGFECIGCVKCAFFRYVLFSTVLVCSYFSYSGLDLLVEITPFLGTVVKPLPILFTVSVVHLQP